MANKQDIITSIKNLDLFLKVPALKGAKARINKNGNPFAYVGGFNMVFQLFHNSKKWAFRVWHVPMGKHEERYLKISAYLNKINLPYFADFIYDQKGFLVNGELVDTIRMEWLDGIILKEFIERNLSNISKLITLANDFVKMCQDLRDNKISHGDLQEGNILIGSNGEIKLVDYDSICIPEIEGYHELVTGLKGYQHPSRFSYGKTSLKVDYFSELIIYLSILAIAENPDLWKKYQVKDTNYLLFSETDFENLKGSEIYKDLKNISLEIDILLDILIQFLDTQLYTELKPFTHFLAPPVIKLFKPDKDVILQGGEITISWKVENARTVYFNDDTNEVDHKSEITFKPQKESSFILTAIGFKETVKERFDIKIFPTPIIKSLHVPIPIFEKKTNLEINTPEFPPIKLPITNYQNIDININTAINSSEKEIEFVDLQKEIGNYGQKKSKLNSILKYIRSNNLLNHINKYPPNE